MSRTATAPFDRVKIFLITRPPDLGGLEGTSAAASTKGVKALAGAVARLYTEGGVRAFWVGQSVGDIAEYLMLKIASSGNGLSLVKIFPVCIQPISCPGMFDETWNITGICCQIHDV